MIRHDRIILWAALIASVGIHLFILLPGLVEASSPADRGFDEEQLNKSEFKRTPEEEEEEKEELGIDESEASTLTWIGYKEYQEHLARLATVEQAELEAASAMPVAGGAPAAPDSPQATPQQPTSPTTPEAAQTDTMPAAVPNNDQQTASNAPEAKSEPSPATGPASETPDQKPPPPGGLKPTSTGPAPIGETASPIPGAKQDQPSDKLPESKADPKTTPVQNPKDAETPASKKPEAKPEAPAETKKAEPEKPKNAPPAQPPETPAKPSKSGPGGSKGDAPPGEQSPQAKEDTAEDLPPKPNASKSDSSATSTIKVPRKDWMMGKPIAAHGLQLRPRKPKFTALQKVTSSGRRNLLVRFDFDSKGKPAHAEILSGSGDPRLDANVKASLYKWRASGAKLQELAAGERITIQMELMLKIN